MVEHVEPRHVVLLCAAIVALLASGGWAAEGKPVPSMLSSHPRLLVTDDDLPRLQQQIAAYPEEWERVQSAGLRPPSDPGYGDARALTNAALVYLIARDDRYLANSVALAEHICRSHRFNQYASPEAVFAASDLGPTKRDGVGQGNERQSEQREIDSTPSQDQRTDDRRKRGDDDHREHER